MPRVTIGCAGRLARLFDGFPYKRAHLVAVFGGVQPGELFMSADGEPVAGAVHHCAGHLMLTGDPSCDSVWMFIQEEISRCSRDRPRGNLIPANEAWEHAILRRLGESVTPVRRILMPLLASAHRRALPSATEREDIRVLDLKDASPVDFHPQLLGFIRRNWGTVEAFQTSGFGFQAILGNELVSVCLAVTVGDGAAPIQINTVEAYRRRGYARMCAQHFIHKCAELGLIPHWECDEANEASHNLARSLGFAEEYRYTRYHWRRG